jgi:tetratricopeptide (TPR) repeat protein
MNSPRLFAIFLFAAATAYGGQALAETPRERAEDFYKSGADSYFRGDIITALSKFKQGYELDPNAMFLYNISLCYGKLENYSEALTHADLAHTKGLPPEVSDKNMARIAAYRTILKTQYNAELEPVAVAVVDCDSEECAPDATNESEGSQKPTWMGWTGATVAVVGGGMLVGAFLVDSGLDSDITAYDEAIAQADLAQAGRLKSDIEGQQTLGKILVISGSVLAATGIGLFVYDFLDTESVAIVPVGGDQLGAALIHKF